MLTRRGSLFLLIVLALLVLGLWLQTSSVVAVCLTLLLWFLWTWATFTVRLRLVVKQLRFERQLRDERGPVESLWTGRAFEVRVRLSAETPLASPYLHAGDRIPFGLKRLAGEAKADGQVMDEEPIEFVYHVFCNAPGRVRFEGVAVSFADLHGFFCHYRFLREPREYRVLPALADARGHVPTVKRYNLLPLHGRHRHRRPGSGSELLDLRDYLPGDPPKMIAWKASARRDRLITKEFESEVPVRCTFFVDTSHGVRVGPPGHNALTRLVEIVAAVAQATAGARDLPGLCLFDEKSTTYLRPARSRRHLVQVFNHLADVASLPPATHAVAADRLLPLAYGLAQEVYPELMRPDLNRVPWWLPWFCPTPAYPDRRLDRPGIIYLFFFVVLALLPLTAFGLFSAFVIFLVYEILQMLLGVPVAVAGSIALGVGLGTIAYARFEGLYRALPQFVSLHRRQLTRWRKQLSSLLSVHYGLAPGGAVYLMEHDRVFVRYVQRFLAEHHVPYELPYYDRRGRYLFASPEKLEVLAEALLRAVGRGRDNELFVLLGDFLEAGDRLGPLLNAVKVAVARHHQVLVICTWPPGVPPPPATLEKGAGGLKAEELEQPAAARLATVVKRVTVLRFHRAYHRLRRTFARLGVQVLCASDRDSVQLILGRLERLRAMERGVR